MIREELRIIHRRCSPYQPAKIIRNAVQVVNSITRSKTVKAGGRHQAGAGRRREDQARHAKRGGTRHIGRAHEPVHADEQVPEPPHELERANQQGQYAAEHMHAEGELVLEVGLPLLGEVDLGVER
jgi:hypothetical protein